MKLCRTNALIPLPTNPSESMVGKEGYPVSIYDGMLSIHGDAVDGSPIGIIVHGAAYPEKATVAIAAGGLAGTVRVKLLQPVTSVGAFLRLLDSVNGCAFGPDPGSGTRIVMAQALETGAIGELIEAVLFTPVFYEA